MAQPADRFNGPGAEKQMPPRSVLDRPLVLASASPRRADLLTQVGIDYEVRIASVPEDADVPGADPAEVAQAHARDKALHVADQVPGRLVLGADTVVVLDGRVLGKPEDAGDARRMLRALSGRGHDVITAVAVAASYEYRGEPGAELLALEHETTQVQFRDLSEDEIDAYVASGEPMDKAGAYGIQGRGALLVRRIDGCYFNVVGLPVSRTCELLTAIGYRIPWMQTASDRGRRP